MNCVPPHAFRFFALLGLVCGLAFCPHPARAGEIIIYNGDRSALQDILLGHSGGDFFNSLAPAGSSGGISNSLSGNIIIVNHNVPGTVFGAVHGASGPALAAAAVSDNLVYINTGLIRGEVFGGFARNDFGDASATGNNVIIRSGLLRDEVYGGYAFSDSGAVFARGNRIVVLGGTLDKFLFGGFAQTGDNTATASRNEVILNNGLLYSDVSGGYASSDSMSVSADNNKVTVNGGTLNGMAFGGFARSASGSVTATCNSLVIRGGIVNGEVSGGVVTPLSANMPADASYNRVTIGGDAEVHPNIYGGRSLEAVLLHGTATRAVHNSVTLTGAPKLAGTGLFGGYVGTGLVSKPGLDVFSGNTLNIWNYSGSPVRAAHNFQFFNFGFPTAQSGPVLAVTGPAVLGANDGTGRSATITASTTGGANPLPVGASVTLLQAGVLNAADFSQTQAAGRHGALFDYLWNLSTAGNALTATVSKTQTRPQAKALAEGYLMGTALLNQSADLIAGQGLRNALGAAKPGFGAFGALSGGWSRYNSGSHADISGLSLLAGLAFGAALPPGRLTLGAFFEYGAGAYDTYDSFANAADVNGDGNVRHLGGGVLGRLDFTEAGPGHLYTEASLRAGRLHNEYSSSDLRDFSGRKADYTTNSTYYGLHFGSGYLWNLTEKAALDTYAKYFWTRQDGKTLTLSTDDRVKFEDADSRRLRLGSRFSYALSERVRPYLGAAWEYEFAGRAKAAAYGYDLDRPELKGGTGMGEFGLSLEPAPTLPLALDLGLQGYLGTRRGVAGSVQMKFEF